MLHSLCQLASWAFVAVLITVLPGVGGENSPRGTVSSGTFHQEANNCLPAQLGGIPPGRPGLGCGRVPRGSAHASCGAERTCLRLASRGGSAPTALRCRGAEEVQPSIGSLLLPPPPWKGWWWWWRARRAKERALFSFFFFPCILWFLGRQSCFIFAWAGMRMGTGGSEGIGDEREIARPGGKYTAFQIQ